MHARKDLILPAALEAMIQTEYARWKAVPARPVLPRFKVAPDVLATCSFIFEAVGGSMIASAPRTRWMESAFSHGCYSYRIFEIAVIRNIMMRTERGRAQRHAASESMRCVRERLVIEFGV